MPVKTTLVVDDSKSARIMLSRMLQKVGLEVEMLESGEAAVEYMTTNSHPDVIFMDHMMPGMDGVEACQAISAKHSVPIFMYTSKEGPEYEAEATAAGAAGLLGKPAELSRLTAIIAELNESQAIVKTDVEPVVSSPVPQESPIDTIVEVEPPLIQPEKPTMSKEMIEEVAGPIAKTQIGEALGPILDAIAGLKSSIADNQSEVRKLVSRQASATNLVTQPVLDASLKQTSVQFQNQLTNELKTIRDLIERSTELSQSDLDKIKSLAVQAGTSAGAEQGEKSATSAAEAVAAKVSAAQAQIQVQQDIMPLMAKLKLAQTVSTLSLFTAAAAIALSIIL